jgi:hypothetical protein
MILLRFSHAGTADAAAFATTNKPQAVRLDEFRLATLGIPANLWLGAMKTEDDLLEAIARYSLESTGASEKEIDHMLREFRTRLIANLKTGPAKLLTDEEYAHGFEEMKKEAAAFLQYLMTHDIGSLPSELRGENVEQRAAKSI